MSNLSKSQLKILGFLAGKTDGTARFNEMVEKIGLSRATLSRNLKYLVKEEYVKRRVDNQSGKYPPPVYYTITKKGLEAIKRIPFGFKKGLKEVGKLTKVEYKTDDTIKELLEGYARAHDVSLDDFLKAFTFCVDRLLVEKQMREKIINIIDLKDDDFIRLVILLKAGLVNVLKDYWMLEMLVDVLNEEYKQIGEPREDILDALQNMKVKLVEFRKNIYEILSKIIDAKKEKYDAIAL